MNKIIIRSSAKVQLALTRGRLGQNYLSHLNIARTLDYLTLASAAMPYSRRGGDCDAINRTSPAITCGKKIDKGWEYGGNQRVHWDGE